MKLTKYTFSEEFKEHYKMMGIGIIGMPIMLLVLAVVVLVWTSPAWLLSSVKIAGHTVYDNPTGAANMARAINSITTSYIASILILLFAFAFYLISILFLTDRLIKSFGISDDSSAAFLFYLMALIGEPYAAHKLWTWMVPGTINNIFDLCALVIGSVLVIIAIDIVLHIETKTQNGQTASV